MKAKTIINCIITGLVSFTLLACGNAGSGGLGNTVYVTAGAKDNSTFSISTQSRTAGAYNSGSLDFTVTSTIYPHSTGITPSAVSIEHAEISYTPLIASDLVTMSPPIASWTKAVGPSIVTAGGSTDITMTVVDYPQMVYLFNLFPDTTIQYRYELNVVFTGTEVNSGLSIRCNKTVSNFYVTSGT